MSLRLCNVVFGYFLGVYSWIFTVLSWVFYDPIPIRCDPTGLHLGLNRSRWLAYMPPIGSDRICNARDKKWTHTS